MLATCEPVAGIVAGEVVDVPRANPSTSTTTTTTTTALVPTAGPADVRIRSCDKRAEVVVLENRGGETISLSGWLLHDDGRKHEFGLGGLSLGPGESIAILTGPDASPAAGAVVWKNQNVWNNDGDTALLLQNGGLIDRQPC